MSVRRQGDGQKGKPSGAPPHRVRLVGVGPLLLLLLVLAAPLATAGDPFREPVCAPGLPCVGPGTCTEVVCVPTSCEPAMRCVGHVNDPADCAENLTIDGRMCQTRLAIGLDRGEVHGPEGLVVPGSDVWVAATVSEGSVHGMDLANEWMALSAETDATLAGVAVGRTSAGIYGSDVQTEGQRGGIYGMLLPADGQTWTQVALIFGTDAGPGPEERVQVAVWFHDLMPNGCHTRSASGRADVDCPRLHEFLP